MKYTYDTYTLKTEPPSRIDTTTRFEDLENQINIYDKENFSTFFRDRSVQIFDNVTGNCIDSLNDYDDLDSWRIKLEREYAWRPSIKFGTKSESPANELPSHAKHQFVDDTGFHDTSQLYSKEELDRTEQYINKLVNTGYPKKDAVNPAHYQGFLTVETDVFQNEKFNHLQWLETKCRERRFIENPDHFIAALMLQVDKYLDRVGYKDKDLQEFEKGLWYLKFLVAYIKNGKQPILVRNIDAILARK